MIDPRAVEKTPAHPDLALDLSKGLIVHHIDAQNPQILFEE